MIDELRNDARGEKPKRQQHIQNEHAQKLDSHTGGAANVKGVTRTEGAEHKKNSTAPKVRTLFLSFGTPLGREVQYERKMHSRLGSAYICCDFSLCMEMNSVTARGLESNTYCAVRT